MSCSKQNNPFSSDLNGDVALSTQYYTSHGDTIFTIRTFFEDGLLVQQVHEVYGTSNSDKHVTDFKHVATEEGFEMYANGTLSASASKNGDKKQWYDENGAIDRSETKLSDNQFFHFMVVDNGQLVDTTTQMEKFTVTKYQWSFFKNGRLTTEPWAIDTTYLDEVEQRDRYNNVISTQTDDYTIYFEYEYN